MPAQSFSSCSAINQRLLANSGIIGPDTYERGREVDPIWLGLIAQRPWTNHVGTVVKTTIFERSGLTVAPTWAAVTPSSGSTTANACVPPLTTISNSMTTQEYQRYHIALESDPLCLEDIRDSVNPKASIQAFQDNLMGNANYVRKERHRSEYFRLSNHKIVVAPGLPEDDDAFPLTLPTSAMTMGVLRTYYPQILREADGTSGVNKVATGSRGNQNFLFISSMETIENMVLNDTKIRDDFRWSPRVSELLSSYADKFSYGGFIMVNESFPERFNWNGAAFVRVPEYAPSATTLGNKLEINPYWTHAAYEVSYIFHPDVMASRVPSPDLSFGDVKYRAQNYGLEWRWINEFDRNCNVDGKMGFFRAVGMQASEPIFRQFGYAFLAKKCGPALDLVDCPSGSGYSSGPFN